MRSSHGSVLVKDYQDSNVDRESKNSFFFYFFSPISAYITEKLKKTISYIFTYGVCLFITLPYLKLILKRMWINKIQNCLHFPSAQGQEFVNSHVRFVIFVSYLYFLDDAWLFITFNMAATKVSKCSYE